MRKYRDECFRRINMNALIEENASQLMKWGVQNRTLPEWLMFLTEEVGELAEAIAEFIYRDGTPTQIWKEAIQTSTLALKIAEMIEVQEIEE